MRLSAADHGRLCGHHGTQAQNDVLTLFHTLVPAVVLGFAVLPAYGQSLPGSGALPLRSAVTIALANSVQMEAARLAVNIAEHQINEAYSGVFPQLSLEASYRRFADGWEQVFDGDKIQRRESEGSLDNAWSAGLRLNQAVLDMRVFSGLEAAQELRELRGEELRGAAQQLVDLVRRRYFAALLAQERELLTEQSIARLQQTLGETRARFREGFASEDEVLRLEVQIANLEANLLQARNQIAAAHGALLVALGQDPLQAVTLQGTLSELRLSGAAGNSAANADLLAVAGAERLAAAGTEELRRSAMTDRSDLRQLRATETLAGLQLEVQEAAYLPTIRASANADFTSSDEDYDPEYGIRSGQNGKEWIQWQLTASIGVSLQWQMFGGFGHDARVAQRREEVRQANARLRQSELEMRYQVSTMISSLHEARERAAGRLRSIEQAERSYAIAAARYREGVGSQLDVTAAESTLLESQFSYAQAAHDYLAAASQLELAVGQVPLAALAPAAAGEQG